MVRRYFGSFLPGSVEPMVRRNYRFELTSVCCMAAAIACVDANVMGVLAEKAWKAGPLVITIIAGAEPIANITSFLWTRVLHGKDRVRATNLMQIGALACLFGIALAPFSTGGKWALLILALLARVFLTGIISARTDLWRANYPRSLRGRVTGRLTVIATLVVATTALVIASVMDIGPGTLQRMGLGFLEGGHAFRPVYAMAGLTALVGVRAFSRIRWRGRAAQLKSERAAPADGRHAASAWSMIRVLKEDRDYRRFMTAQFVLGFPNIAAGPIFILALSDSFTLGYTQSIGLTRVIPVLVPVLVIPLWARLLDRMHIIRFRAYHSWVFVLANGLMAAALLMQNLPLLYAARIVLGIAFGGGMLAWNLGHHDFARRDLATIYMGIHVTLTGVRGVFAPFFGTLLYAPWALTLADTTVRFPGLGAWTFVLLALMTGVGAVMFVVLYRSTRAVTGRGPERD